ncbi:MAG TPA: HAD-IC family P-type ATPase, partial [Methylomirabilota bacterium]|nr:HAD-IC family P-type ATPase [Methylomirabilota bacterium]
MVWRTLRGMASGRFAADLVAMLAIVTAVILGQPLPGLIVVLMQTGGETLERYAEGRASEAVRELEAAAPRLAHRIGPEGVEDVAADAVVVGDRLLIRPGEMVPCDGVVLDGRSHVDVARITGEPMPLSAAAGVALRSGSLNLEGPLTLRATALARESQYARIVELVRTAQASKSPLQRLADRYAVWFTPVTLLVCAAAWLASGDPERVLAVLVVATPCPLILATPVAIIGGINRAAAHGIIFRHGTALE